MCGTKIWKKDTFLDLPLHSENPGPDKYLKSGSIEKKEKNEN